MKNSLFCLSSILDTAENKISELVDRILEIIQTEVQIEKNPEKDGSPLTFGTMRQLTYI